MKNFFIQIELQKNNRNCPFYNNHNQRSIPHQTADNLNDLIQYYKMDTSLTNPTDPIHAYIEAKKLVNKMFKTLKMSIHNVLYDITVYIIPVDKIEITIYRYSDDPIYNERIDFYDMYCHRSTAIELLPCSIPREVKYQYDVCSVNWYGDESYKELCDIIVDEETSTHTYCFDLYITPLDWEIRGPSFMYHEQEKYQFVETRSHCYNSLDDIDRARKLVYGLMICFIGGRYKKLVKRLEQKLRYIICNSLDTRTVFSNEIYEKEFYRREWL